MKRPLIKLLVLVLILVGLLTIGVRFNQVAQGFIGSGYYFDTDPNEPEPSPELAVNICLNDDPNDPNDISPE